MKGLNDFLYDKNDILIALLILVLAAFLIAWRMDVIMAYPETLAEQTDTTDTTEETAVGSEETSGSTEGTSSDLWENGSLTQSVTVTIEGGSATSAVQSLIDAGLFTSYEEYTQVCEAAGYVPEAIKATTFTFEAGSTQTDIAKQVTE